MGGLGSGNWQTPSMRPRVGQFRAIDIHDVSYRGRLRLGMTFNLPVRTPDISLDIRVRGNSVLAEYVGGTGDPLLRAWSLRTTATDQHFGGERIWFRCPGCGGRVRFLYVGIHYIGCRQCLRLLYPSQYENDIGRGFSRLRKATGRLRLDAFLQSNSAKPKGMHAVTFIRLLERQRAEQERLREMVARRFAMPLEPLTISPLYNSLSAYPPAAR